MYTYKQLLVPSFIYIITKKLQALIRHQSSSMHQYRECYCKTLLENES